jgi:deoxyribodipyrimidine photo-lyase
MENRAIVWFRNDLRIHDNEALTEALLKKADIIPVYVFDERIFKGKTSYDLIKFNLSELNLL